MEKPVGMSGSEYYHYKRINNPKRYSPLAKACKKVTDFQKKGKIKRIIDLGSSCGSLLKELEIIYDTKDTFGVDISKYAEKHWCAEGKFIKSDLNYENSDILSSVKKIDLIVSFEAAEHLTELNNLFYVTSLLAHKKSTMIFGAASPLQKSSKGHVNCKWPSWWRRSFEENGGWIYDHLATARFSYNIGKENGSGQEVPEYYLNALVFRKDAI